MLIVSPDSDVLSVIYAVLSNENPDLSLPLHAKYAFRNGEVRAVNPVVKRPETLATGQTPDEAKSNTKRMRAVRVGGSVSNTALKTTLDWFDIWAASVDRS